MNSTIVSSMKHDFHTFSNAEFTGVFDCCYYPTYNYHIFIRYGDKIYMEVKGVGEIVITFAELQKNKYWNYYYNLSLMLSIDPHKVAKDLRYNSDYIDYNLYEEKRVWSTYSPVIINNRETNTKILDNRDNNCYYKINPFDLEKMEYTLLEDLEIFRNIYMSNGFQNNIFETMHTTYNNLAIEHQTRIMEEMMEELVELSAFFRELEKDKNNLDNLLILYDKVDMNSDVLTIIYNNLLSVDGRKTYEYVMNELGNCNQLQRIAQIIAA